MLLFTVLGKDVLTKGKYFYEIYYHTNFQNSRLNALALFQSTMLETLNIQKEILSEWQGLQTYPRKPVTSFKSHKLGYRQFISPYKDLYLREAARI
jgi:hypothetical protein